MDSLALATRLERETLQVAQPSNLKVDQGSLKILKL